MATLWMEAGGLGRSEALGLGSAENLEGSFPAGFQGPGHKGEGHLINRPHVGRGSQDAVGHRGQEPHLRLPTCSAQALLALLLEGSSHSTLVLLFFFSFCLSVVTT